jgi:hypothetical protein
MRWQLWITDDETKAAPSQKQFINHLKEEYKIYVRQSGLSRFVVMPIEGLYFTEENL